MSRTTDESDNRKLSDDLPDSPSIDEGSCGGSGSGGGAGLKKGPWTSAEDAILVEYVKKHGEGNWNAVQKHSGLSRCGKSCRLRWANHLRPNLKKGAFTPEEEQLIIELHAKLGNKWARMATNLPGRTDNEIKNYWNTRIKRRQRAGLPLYPPNVCLQAKIENTQDQATDEFSIGDKQQNELLQNNSDIFDAIFPEYIANHGKLPYAPPFPDISFGNLLNQGLGSHGFGIIDSTNPSKRLRESETLLPGHSPVMRYPSNPEKDHRQFGLTFPYDPDPGSKSMPTMSGAIPGSHAFTNGNLSTSQSPQTVKSELPSLQFPDTDTSSWLACPPSPTAGELDAYVDTPSVSFQSECASPKSSGLLDALVLEAQAKCSARNRLSEKSTDSSVAATSDLMESSAPHLCNTEWEFYDPSSPLGCSAASAFSECTPPTSGSSLDEPLPTKDRSGFNVMLESGHSVPVTDEEPKFKKTCHLDLTRPDALLAWSCGSRSDNSIFIDPIANLLGEDALQYRPVQPGTSSGSSEDLGFE